MNTSSITNEDAGKTIAEVLLWLLQAVTAFLFFVAAYPKLTGLPAMMDMFDRIGFGQWFRYATGGTEALGAVLLLAPGMAKFGAWLLIAVTLGAAVTHLTVLGDSPAHAIEYLALAALIAWFRRHQVLKR